MFSETIQLFLNDQPFSSGIVKVAVLGLRIDVIHFGEDCYLGQFSYNFHLATWVSKARGGSCVSIL